MIFPIVKKCSAFLLLASALNAYPDECEHANVTVKLPLGAAFISFVSYASDHISDSEYKTLTVGKSTTQALDLGDMVLVETMQTLSSHRCDYFRVAGSGEVSVIYSGPAWEPLYNIDAGDKLKLVYQSYTNLFRACKNPDFIKNLIY